MVKIKRSDLIYSENKFPNKLFRKKFKYFKYYLSQDINRDNDINFSNFLKKFIDLMNVKKILIDDLILNENILELIENDVQFLSNFESFYVKTNFLNAENIIADVKVSWIFYFNNLFQFGFFATNDVITLCKFNEVADSFPKFTQFEFKSVEMYISWYLNFYQGKFNASEIEKFTTLLKQNFS
jgi:hypothetical protein